MIQKKAIRKDRTEKQEWFFANSQCKWNSLTDEEKLGFAS